jgi:hypothetical protein
VVYWQGVSRQQGKLTQLAEPGVPRGNGTHFTGPDRRVTFHTKPRTRPGLMGFSGAAAWAGLIDGLTQLLSDWNLCLSVMQKANRFALSLALGVAAGAFAGIVFTGTVGAALPFTPIIAGAAAGMGVSWFFNKTIREPWYLGRPDLFGA